MKNSKKKTQENTKWPDIQIKPINVGKLVKLAKKAEASWREQEEYLRNEHIKNEYSNWGGFLQ